MNLKIRPASTSDIDSCSQIIFTSFDEFSKKHGFPCEFPSQEMASRLASFFITNPSIFSIVAEIDGCVVGSNFLDERNPIRSIGPLSVDPSFQGQGIGRRLMQTMLNRGKGSLGIRLVQNACNTVSISLYTSLGFEAKEPLMLMRGIPKIEHQNQNNEVRSLYQENLNQCQALCLTVNGFQRTRELEDILKIFSPLTLWREGKIRAYSSSMNFWMTNHCVAESEEDMRHLLSGIGRLSSDPFYFILPIRHFQLFQWSLKMGFKAIVPLTLMVMGQYQEPKGIYFPSLSF